MKIKLILLLFISTIAVQAQEKLETLSDKGNSGSLRQLDLNIVSLVPTVEDYKDFKKKIKNLPLDYIKYVDSIDFTDFDKKLSVIQIYSQNRTSRSKNAYELKKNIKNDSLKLMIINLDMKLKDLIIDLEQYNDLKVEYEIIEKIVKTDTKINRIIFRKPIIEKVLNP